MPHRLVPKSVIKRLPIYLRILNQLITNDIEIMSSRELSMRTGFTAEQIRKDLAYFGAFGTRGTGYNTVFLRDKLLKIIGLDTQTKAVIVGAGHLGIAFTGYTIAKNPYIDVIAIFDKSPDVIGEDIMNLEVMDVSCMEKVIKDNDVKISVISVPAQQAQIIVDRLVECGIKAILNFAPVKINIPDGIYVHNVDLTNELQSLIYYSSAERERLKRINHETS